MIKQGDSLSKIAKKAKLSSWWPIWDLNKKIHHPNLIYPGQKLLLPAKGEKVKHRPLPALDRDPVGFGAGRRRRLIRVAERVRASQGWGRQAVLNLELPKPVTETMLVAIARHTFPETRERWTFHMLQPKQVLTVWDAIRALPGKDRPHQVRHLFDLVLAHLEWDTGLVILTREELAQAIGTTPGHVSRMMGTLERIGVICRERVRLDGMRGRGIARYRVNPHVAWHGGLETRQEQASKPNRIPLPLTLIDGSKE